MLPRDVPSMPTNEGGLPAVMRPHTVPVSRNPQPSLATSLHELADRLERLRPDWRAPEGFFSARAELAARLRDIALPRLQQGPWRPPVRRSAVLPPPDRERRFQALLTAKEAELVQLRRALASAVPRIRRRRLADDRQLCLVLATDGRQE
jgi:hypothetical protein